MIKGSLTFVPSGGLANRMRAIASAYTLTQQTGIDLRVVWFQDWALNAPFHSIFQPIEQLNVREAKGLDFVLYDRARRRNLWLPALPQRLIFERSIKEQSVDELERQRFDFDRWACGHRCYMSSYSVFGNVHDEIYRQLFVPVKEVTDVVNSFQDSFSDHTIGVHVRRTDHTVAIESSPDYLFLEKVEKEIDTNEDTCVFLATDSNEVKSIFVRKYGTRVIMQQAEARRDSIEGIRGGLIDMYTLSKTCKIFGSAGSTFSPMAASLGDVKLEIVTKNS